MFGVLEELEAAIGKATASEQWLDPAQMCRLAERVEFLKLRALYEFDRSGDWAADGFVSAASWLRAHTNMSHGSAAHALALARSLQELPETAAAFEAGEISRQQAAAIADACTPDRASAIVEVEPQLVDIARQVKPRELRAVVRRLTDALDAAPSDIEMHGRRRLHVSQTMDGMGALDGVLDAEGTEVVQTALEAEMSREWGADDTRTRPQRRADALVNICRRDLDRGDAGSTRGVRPHVSVVVDVAELEGRAPLVVAKVRAEGEHIGPLSRATLEQLTCDCSISRVITDGPSQVLDVGRATRTPPPAIWKALVVRDRHCVATGCDRPPGFCQSHHIHHWTKGGPTSLDNLVLLCHRHHRERHLLDARSP